MIETEEIVTRLTLSGRAQYSAELARARESVAAMSTEMAVVGRAGLESEKGLGFFRRGLGQLAGFAKTAALTIGVLGVGLVYLGSKFIDSAADADKAHARYVAVFQSLTSQTDGFIANLQAKFGTPTNVLESGIAQFGRLAESVGISRDKLVPFGESLVQASIDLASFYNLDPSNIMMQVQRGVAGQMRGLKALGIVIRETDVTARAAEMGFGKHADEATRMIIRQQMIMEQIGVVTKNLSHDSGTLANQQWQLHGRMEQLKITAGRLFVPIALLAVTGLNKLLIPATTMLNHLIPVMRDEFSKTGPVVSAIGRPVAILAAGFNILVTQGPMALVDWLDNLMNTGSFFHDEVRDWVKILGYLWTILSQDVVPVVHAFAPVLWALAIPLNIITAVLGFFADQGGITKTIVGVLIIGFIAWRAAVWAHNIALAVLQLILWASRAPYAIMVAAGWAHAAVLSVETAATWALSSATWSALLPYIALIALFVLVAVAAYLLLDHFDGLRDGAVDAFGGIEDAGYAVTGAVMGAFWGMVEGVKGAINDLLGWIETGLNFGIEMVNEVITGVNHIPGVYIDHLDYVTLPRLHQGGRVIEPGYVNWKPGEEMAYMPGGATVVPLPAQAQGTVESQDRPPQIVQLVVDRKVLAEVMVDGHADIEARR